MTARPEDALQRQVAWLLDLSGLLWFHPANERRCTPAQGARLRAAGVKAGVPDVLVLAAFGAYHGLAIELKAGRNRPTAEQSEWLRRLNAAGWRTAVCRSLDEVHRLLLDCYPGNHTGQPRTASVRSVAPGCSNSEVQK